MKKKKVEINYLEVATAIRKMNKKQMKEVIGDIGSLLTSLINRTHDIQGASKDYYNLHNALTIIEANFTRDYKRK